MDNRSGRAGIPYSPDSAEWLIDEETVVSRNDVLYTTPSPEPWEAMPVGGGDLSAMAYNLNHDLDPLLPQRNP